MKSLRDARGNVTSLFGSPARLAFLLGGLLLSNPICAIAKTLADLLVELGYQPVKMQLLENHYFVDVGINGRSRRALIDTGSSCSAVDNNIAGSLPRLGEISFVGRKETKRDLASLAELEFSGLSFTNFPVAVIELREPGEDQSRTGTRLAVRSSYEVILGKDFLEESHAILDVSARKLFLRAERPSAAQTNLLARTLAASGMTNSPLLALDAKHWVVGAKVNGHSAAMLIDTGAVATKLDATSAQRCDVTGERQKIISHGVENITVKGVVSKVKLLEVFECQFRNYPIGVSDLSPWGLGAGSGTTNRIEGLVACDVLARARAILDCYAGRIWVIPATIKE